MILFPAQMRAFMEKKNRKGNYSFDKVDYLQPGSVVEAIPDGETLALVQAILAYRLKKPLEAIKLRKIYRSKEESACT